MSRQLHSLNDALAYFTECQLATVEMCKLRKSTGKGELARQQDIAESMVEHCRRLGVTLPPSQFEVPQVPRLRKLLNRPTTQDPA